jgi:hypothetical protein
MNILVKNLERFLSDPYLIVDNLHLEQGYIYLLERQDHSVWLVVKSEVGYRGVLMDDVFVDISNDWVNLNLSHPDNKFKLKGIVDLVFSLS